MNNTLPVAFQLPLTPRLASTTTDVATRPDSIVMPPLPQCARDVALGSRSLSKGV